MPYRLIGVSWTFSKKLWASTGPRYRLQCRNWLLTLERRDRSVRRRHWRRIQRHCWLTIDYNSPRKPLSKDWYSAGFAFFPWLSAAIQFPVTRLYSQVKRVVWSTRDF